MKKILIAYATDSGSTAEVAQAVAEALADPTDSSSDPTNLSVEVRRIDEVDNIEEYSAVVIGAPMILGWHRAAVKFVKQQHAALSRRPVAYFFTAMSLTRLGEQSVAGIPVAIDPNLAKPPKNPARLGIKEKYARVANYLNPAIKAAPQVKPVSAAFFGGKLELFRLKFIAMLFVMIVIQAQPGDLRNWPFIREWAAGLRQTFKN